MSASDRPANATDAANMAGVASAGSAAASSQRAIAGLLEPRPHALVDPDSGWHRTLRGMHETSALLFAASLPLATAPKDVLAAFALVLWLLRLPVTWRDLLLARRSLIVWSLAACVIVHAVSVRWSLNPSEGIEELRSLRYLGLPLIFWPVLRAPGALALGLMFGVVGLVALQVMQDREYFDWTPAYGGRLGGLLHPPIAGLFCATGLLLALAVARDGSFWPRGPGEGAGEGSGERSGHGWSAGRSWQCTWLAALLVPIAGYGLVASGGRAAWIATMVGVAVLVVQGAWRWSRPAGGERRGRRVAALAVMVVVAAVAGWTMGGDLIRARVQQVAADLERAETGDFDSDNGFRVVAARTAGRMFLERPWRGWGAGSFRPYAETTEHAEVLRRGWHPHSVPLHVASEQGVLGLLPLLTLVFAAGWAGLRSRHVHAAAGGALAAGLAFAAAAQFDAWHVAGQTVALAMVLLMLVLRSPRDARSGVATDPSGDSASPASPASPAAPVASIGART
ncbi:MAG: O-antigen ligase family protein [Phycisphaerales bacterium]